MKPDAWVTSWLNHRPVSRPWEQWEDYKAGLYQPHYTFGDIENSRQLLSEPDRFSDAATEMVGEWPNAAIQNLSNMWSGRNAWVGQATCLYVHGSPAAATRDAWSSMTEQAHINANRAAVQVRTVWERRRDGGETLFTV